jgi:PiT family inorganic phosphate transporter
MIWTVLLLAALLLAYGNGANDNFKGVATLFGTGTTDYRRALAIATVSTGLGSLAALILARGLLAAFSGKGLVPPAVLADPIFLPAVGLGAAATVLLATRLGLPISTTHSLVGALVGAGLVAGSVSVVTLGKVFLIPLLVSPLISLGTAATIYPAFRWLRRSMGVDRETCLCIGEELVAASDHGVRQGAVAVAGTAVTATVAAVARCEERYTGSVAGVGAQSLLDNLHYLSAAAVGFARGLNDTPKIAALLLGVSVVTPAHGIVAVAVVMSVGGLLSARRVAETMSHRITAMNHGQGFTANLVTAFLVIIASRWGVPVSTTHVSCGALFGIGTATGNARWRTIATIAGAWMITLPLAAAVAATACALLARLG